MNPHIQSPYSFSPPPQDPSSLLSHQLDPSYFPGTIPQYYQSPQDSADAASSSRNQSYNLQSQLPFDAFSSSTSSSLPFPMSGVSPSTQGGFPMFGGDGMVFDTAGLGGVGGGNGGGSAAGVYQAQLQQLHHQQSVALQAHHLQMQQQLQQQSSSQNSNMHQHLQQHLNSGSNSPIDTSPFQYRNLILADPASPPHHPGSRPTSSHSPHHLLTQPVFPSSNNKGKARASPPNPSAPSVHHPSSSSHHNNLHSFNPSLSPSSSQGNQPSPEFDASSGDDDEYTDGQTKRARGPAVKEERGAAGRRTSTAPPEMRMVPIEEQDQEPLYVNAKQYARILKRRQQRHRLEQLGRVARERKPYLHESRHAHALRRPRGKGGRFLTAEEIAALPPPDPSLVAAPAAAAAELPPFSTTDPLLPSAPPTANNNNSTKRKAVPAFPARNQPAAVPAAKKASAQRQKKTQKSRKNVGSDTDESSEDEDEEDEYRE